MVTGSPANDAGLKVGDFLISVQGMDVFECDHAQVVTAVKNAGNSLNLAVERYSQCCKEITLLFALSRLESCEVMGKSLVA